jgi:hypothetical protein
MHKEAMRKLDRIQKKGTPVSQDQDLSELKYVGTTNLERKLFLQCRCFSEQRKNIRESFDFCFFFRFRLHCIHT